MDAKPTFTLSHLSPTARPPGACGPPHQGRENQGRSANLLQVSQPVGGRDGLRTQVGTQSPHSGHHTPWPFQTLNWTSCLSLTLASCWGLSGEKLGRQELFLRWETHEQLEMKWKVLWQDSHLTLIGWLTAHVWAVHYY